jgi:hypothetical protein
LSASLSQVLIRLVPWLRSQVSSRPGPVRAMGVERWRPCAGDCEAMSWQPARWPVRGWPIRLRLGRWLMLGWRSTSCLWLGSTRKILVMRSCGSKSWSVWGVGWMRPGRRWWNGSRSKVLHTADGHGSAKIMVRHVARLTEAEALARAKTARLGRHLSKVTAAWKAGEVSTCAVRALGRVDANPRVMAAMCQREDEFLARCQDDGREEFCAQGASLGTADR